MTSPRALAEKARSTSIRGARALRVWGVGTIFILTWATAALIDLLAHFSMGFRFGLTTILIGLSAYTWRALRRRHPSISESAIEVERIEAMENLFLTGVEIEDGRSSGTEGVQSAVMNQAALRVSPDLLDRIDASEERRWRLWAASTCAAFFFLCAISTDVLGRHALRVLIPFAKIDPATATRITIEPGDTAVMEGTSLLIRATARRALPVDAALEWTDSAGTITSVPMDLIGSSADSKIFECRIPVTENLGYRIAAGDATSFEYKVRCLVPPRIRRIVAYAHPPSYSGHPPVVLENPSRIKVFEGGKIVFEIEADRNIISAALELDSSFYPLTSNGTKANGEITASESGTLVIVLDGEEGRRRSAPIEIEVIPDRPPVLHVRAPAKEVKAVASEEIRFDLHLADDVGLAALNVFVAVADKPETLWHTYAFEGDTDANLAFRFPLEELSLEIGDAVNIRLEARDQKPRTDGTNRTRVIEIIPYEQFFRDSKERPDPRLEGLRVPLQEFIRREKAIISQTTDALGGDSDAFSAAGGIQEKLRLDVQTVLNEFAKKLKNDPLDRKEVGTVPDEILMALDQAEVAMAEAVRQLAGNDGRGGLASERIALDRLMKAFRALLTIIVPAPSEGTGSGEAQPAEDAPPMPSSGETRNTGNSGGGGKTGETADRAQGLIDRARELMNQGGGGQAAADELAREARRLAEQQSGEGAAQLQRIADALARAGSGGSGAIVPALAKLIEALEDIRDTSRARQAIDDALVELENNPDAVPPELREKIRRYFEKLAE